MRATTPIPALLLGFLALGLLLPCSCRAQEPARNDLFGDPLPAGAISRMGTIRFHQGYLVQSLAWSPDGKIIASGSFGIPRQVVLWDAATGLKQRTLEWKGSSPLLTVF